MDGQDSAGPRRLPGDPLPVCTRAQRLRGRRGRSAGAESCGEAAAESEAARAELWESGLAAGWASVAAEVAEPPVFKAALTFLGISLANGSQPGRKREGGQSGFLSPPPTARRTTFQLESEGGGGGWVRRALELLRKRGARPRGLGALGRSTSALAPRRRYVQCEHPDQ